MTRELLAVAPETGIETVARILQNHRISGLPVVDDGGQAIGLISVTDILDPERVASDRPGISTFYHISDGWASLHGDLTHKVGHGRAEDIMSKRLHTIEQDATLQEAAARLLAQQIHRLIVLKDGRVTGVVTTLDVVRGYFEHDTRAATDLEVKLLDPDTEALLACSSTSSQPN